MRFTILATALFMALPAAALTPPTPSPDTIDTIREQLDTLQQQRDEMNLRLLRLRAEVLGLGRVTRVFVQHVDTVGMGLDLATVTWWLDEKRVVVVDGQPMLEGLDLEGWHTLRFEAEYKGDSDVFSYMDGYRVRMRASHAFHVRPGRDTTVRVETGNRSMTLDATKRLGVTWTVTSVQR